MTLGDLMGALGTKSDGDESTLLILTSEGRITLKEGDDIKNLTMTQLFAWVKDNNDVPTF